MAPIEKEREKRLMVDFKERGDLLIEGPRTSRGPRTPKSLGFRRRRRLLLGVFFPVFLYFFFVGLDLDVMGLGLGYNTQFSKDRMGGEALTTALMCPHSLVRNRRRTSS